MMPRKRLTKALTGDTISVTLGGQPWTLRFVPKSVLPRKTTGLCLWDTREILIAKGMSAKDLLDTLLHEMRHGQHEVLFEAESYVTWTSTELAEALIATGLIDVKEC